MCNDYRLLTDAATIFSDFSELKIRFPEGKPNLEAREDIKITDTAPIVRAVDGEQQAGDLVQRRRSWPGRDKPVYKFRSDGREFTSGRCLIPANGFYEFTEPMDKKEEAQGRAACSRKAASLGSASTGIWRADKDVAEASTMLMCPPARTLRLTTIGRSPFSTVPIGPLGSKLSSSVAQ
jgi:putative SOS response-associated peptidase YedK